MIRRIHGAARMPATVSVPRSSSISPVTARSIREVLGPGALGRVLGEHRDERGRERALGDEPAQEIREAERHEEGVGAGPGAEAPGDHEIPQEARGSG